MMLSLVAAADEQNIIGGGNKLLWNLPDDFARMKELTMGKPLIMGRKTHQSIGRALPGRRNIVITRDVSHAFPGCDVVHSLQEAIELAEKDGGAEAIIFGGGEIYREALPLADRVYLTRVHGSFKGDTAFPALLSTDWALVRSEDHPSDDKHSHSFTFEDYERVRH